jgi:integrase
MTNPNALVPTHSGVPADMNPAIVYISRLRAKRSQETMRAALDVIARKITNGEENAVQFGAEWGELRYQHTAMIKTWLSQRYAEGTVNKMLSALRGVLKEAWKLGYMSAEDYYRAKDIENLPNNALPAGRDLTPGEIRAMMQVCEDDPTPAGARDAAIIAILWVGLRRAEVASLAVEDYEPGTGRITVIHGKGNKQRQTYLDPGAMAALADWLAVRGDGPGALFLRINKSGRVHSSGMTSQSIHAIIKKRGAAAGIDDAACHNFRRTAVGDLLTQGVDISTVARMMGHSQVQTTARYDRRNEKIKEQAANTRRLPYKGRGL